MEIWLLQGKAGQVDRKTGMGEYFNQIFYVCKLWLLYHYEIIKIKKRPKMEEWWL